MSSVFSRAIVLITSASLLACAQDNQESTAPVRAFQTATVGPMRQTASGQVLPESAMEFVHFRVVRAIALALADGQTRSAVYNALRTSPYREGKVRFKTFLASAGSSLLAGARNTEPGLLAALDSVVDLEFYMPVRAHRNQWTGGTNLLVAGVLRDDGRLPVAFDLTGKEVSIQSAEDPPTTPTLALVPVETDFSSPLSGGAGSNSMPMGVGASLLVDPPGVWVTSASFNDDYEGWLMGDPEFELHAFLAQPGAFSDVSCAGADRAGSQFYWDYNNPPTTWLGNVLVALEASVSFGQSEYQVWEDDTGPCTTSSGRPPDTDLSQKNFAATTAAGITWYYQKTDSSTLKKIAKVLAAIPLVISLVTNIQDDDLVGVVSGPDLGCFPPTGPTQFTVKKGTSVTGAVNLDFRMGNGREPLCAPSPPPLPDGAVTVTGRSSVKPNVSCTYVAGATGGTAPYTFEWYKSNSYLGNGAEMLVGTGSSDFVLQVAATDATGRRGISTAKTVTVTSSASNCPT